MVRFFGSMVHHHERRFHGLDLLRGSMMLLGVVLHCALTYMDGPADGGWPLRDPDRSGWAGLVALSIHVFRMPAFFLLAGFFGSLVVARRGLWSWVRDRFARIVVPMVASWVVLFPATKFAFVYAVARMPGDEAQRALAETFRSSVLEHPWANAGPIHLWFLLYLSYFCVIAAACAWAIRAFPQSVRSAAADAFAACFRGWRRAVTIVALTAVTVLPMLPMGAPGVDTPDSFRLHPGVLLCYGTYFAVGWMFGLRPHVLDTLQRGAWWRLGAGVAAMLLSVVLSIVWFVLRGEGRTADDPAMLALHATTQVTVALAAWLSILGGIAVAERHWRTPRPWVRALVDSSYWIYLVHLPVCIAVTGMLIPWRANGTMKMIIAIGICAAVLTVGYRSTRAVLPRRA
ncbi:MAG: hypothetical protein RI990_444 [Planctomycetota bacterium]